MRVLLVPSHVLPWYSTGRVYDTLIYSLPRKRYCHMYGYEREHADGMEDEGGVRDITSGFIVVLPRGPCRPEKMVDASANGTTTAGRSPGRRPDKPTNVPPMEQTPVNLSPSTVAPAPLRNSRDPVDPVECHTAQLSPGHLWHDRYRALLREEVGMSLERQQGERVAACAHQPPPSK